MVVLLDCVERQLLAPLAIDQTKRPVFHLKATVTRERQGIPIVRPSKDHRPRDPHLKTGAYLPGEGLPLKFLAFADRIDTEFSQHQRFIFSEVMQMRQITAEGRLLVQANVKRDEVG